MVPIRRRLCRWKLTCKHWKRRYNLTPHHLLSLLADSPALSPPPQPLSDSFSPGPCVRCVHRLCIYCYIVHNHADRRWHTMLSMLLILIFSLWAIVDPPVANASDKTQTRWRALSSISLTTSWHVPFSPITPLLVPVVVRARVCINVCTKVK